MLSNFIGLLFWGKKWWWNERSNRIIRPKITLSHILSWFYFIDLIWFIGPISNYPSHVKYHLIENKLFHSFSFHSFSFLAFFFCWPKITWKKVHLFYGKSSMNVHRNNKLIMFINFFLIKKIKQNSIAKGRKWK